MCSERTTFLSEVASDLFVRYGAEVGELKVLFPSRRGRIFFSDALSQIINSPIWEPEWISIDDMMSRIAGVEVGEHIRLVAELFRVYREYHPKESFDRFYHWGEVLLADFDMVDKYLIDANQIFRNVSDIKELETDVSYLTEEQLQIIANFWQTVQRGANGEDLSRQKEQFLVVWRSLLPIYNKFRERLTELKIAYSGMVHRMAAEKIRSGEVVAESSQRYVVAGFNALSECEKVLFDALKRDATTHFYWDWDDYYLESERQEAGLFIEGNRLRYRYAAEISHSNFAQPKSVRAVACSSSALQCKYVSKIIEDIVQRDGGVDKRTAIVLTDESLLLPLLHALPEGIGKVNVTMGYPLRQSLAYSFIERILELQNHARNLRSGGEVSFYHLDVVGLLSHPYLSAGVEQKMLREIELQIERERLITLPASMLTRTELLAQIFTESKGWHGRSEYLMRVLRCVASLPFDVGAEAEMRVEFLSFLLDSVAQLHHSIEACGIELSTSTYLSLLRRHLQPLRIPFEGEPLEGVQVMGILETRTLDFDNVILLSMNDDNFPGSRAMQPSYIPYSLRAAYSLPTPEHHDGVYAYYFYRLIQRARRVEMLYCSRADDKSTGEQSRYITQLEMESAFDVARVDVGVDVNLFSSERITIEKSGRVAEQLREFIVPHQILGRDGVSRRDVRSLSPTAFFQYIACPLRFYYRSLARIRTEDELSQEVDSPMFGNILHAAMQTLYTPFVDSEQMVGDRLREAITKITRRDVEAATERAIRSEYFGDVEAEDELSGNLILVREVVVKYIEGGVLKYDRSHPPRRILSVERLIEHNIWLDGERRVRFEGLCDRVDEMDDGSLRIVDYKSGAPHLDYGGVERLFCGDGRDRQSNIFQTLLYSYMMRGDGGERRRVVPSLYYVRAMNGDDYSPKLVDRSAMGDVQEGEFLDGEYEPKHEEFDSFLRMSLNELFDESRPFEQCEDVNSCGYCDFKQLCRRER